MMTSRRQTRLSMAISAPLVAIFRFRPFAGISIDPLIALPVGDWSVCWLMGRARHCNQYMVAGLDAYMAPVAIMLLGTGTLGRHIANSELKDVLDSWPHRFGIAVLAAGARVWRHDVTATASTTAYPRGVRRFLHVTGTWRFRHRAESRYDPCGRHGAGPSAARQLFHATAAASICKL